MIRSDRLNNEQDLSKFETSIVYCLDQNKPESYPCICFFSEHRNGSVDIEYVYVRDLVDNHEDLRSDSRFLDHLINSRVANWEGYNHTCEEFHS